MDPVTAVGVGRAAAGRRFAFYIVVQLASVVLPGFIMTTCFAALVFHAHHARGFGKILDDSTSHLKGPLVLLVDVVWIATAYVVGYVGREFAFRLLGLMEHMGPRRRFTPTSIHEELRRCYGEVAVRKCLRTHPLVKHLLVGRAAGPVPAGVAASSRPGAALQAGGVYEAFVYAKFWLREHNPGLAPDAVEAEINILVSTLPPICTGTWVLIALGPLSTVGSTAVTVGAGAASAMVLASALRLRRVECWETLRNLVEDHEMRLAATRLPQPPPQSDPDADAQGGGAP
ncbi:hypothetical protein [Streptomyces sp. NPDC059819]|uniref:hypothetical protein n=1 Tax=Streptomyces sp. NPDC059819 TaxID=3346963 RepID=UPI00364D8B4B